MKRVLDQASCHFLVSNTIIGYAIAVSGNSTFECLLSIGICWVICYVYSDFQSQKPTKCQLHTQGNQSSQGVSPPGPQLTSSWGQSQSYFCRSPKSTCLPFHPLRVFCDYLQPHHICPSVADWRLRLSPVLEDTPSNSQMYTGCYRPQIDQP